MMAFVSSPSFSFHSYRLFLELKINLILLTYTSGVKKVSLVQEKKKADEATTRTPYQTTQPTHYPLIHLVSRNYTNSCAIRTQSDDEVYANIKRRSVRCSGKKRTSKTKKKRVFLNAQNTKQRAEHLTSLRIQFRAWLLCTVQ